MFPLFVFSTSLVRPGSLQPLGRNHYCSWLGWTVLFCWCSYFVLKILELSAESKEWTINRSAMEQPVKFVIIAFFIGLFQFIP